MKERNEQKLRGNPEASFQLSKDLIKTVMSSDAFKSGTNNPYFVFDVLMGIAEFTHLVLKTMEKSAVEEIDLHSLYKNIIFTTMETPIEDLLAKVVDDNDILLS